MSDYRVSFELHPAPQETQWVADQLEVYNRQQTGVDSGYQPFAIFVRDASGAIHGGLLGVLYWGWLNISILWLDEALRGQGYGTRLLHQAEAFAIEHGCHHAHLDTMSFQALPFYLKHGYQVFGTLDNIPTGHQRYFMMRPLTLPESPPEPPPLSPAQPLDLSQPDSPR